MIEAAFILAPFIIAILAVRANHLHESVTGYTTE